MVRPMNETSRIILLQRHQKSRDVVIFVSGICNEKFHRANAQPYAYDANAKCK